MPNETTTSAKEEREKFREGGGDLKDLVEGGLDIITVYKLLQELDSAQSAEGDPAAVQKHTQLIKESVQLIHAQLLAKLHLQQAQYALQIVLGRIVQATNDKQRAADQLNALVDETYVLEQAAFAQIRMAQKYMDVLIKYAFLSARALEIYTLSDLSDEIFYDYGYLHPDQEQDYLANFMSPAQFIGLYQHAWAQFIRIVKYRDRYVTYFTSGNVVHDVQKLSIKDPAAIIRFQKQYGLLFTIDLQDLPANRFEAKVESVSLALVGAKASANEISCVVQHSGVYSAKKRNGTVVQMILSPQSAIVQAKETQLQYSGQVSGTNPLDLAFWGRGVAATWHLYIESDMIAKNNVDLTSLTEIQIDIGYQAFFQ